MTKRTNPSWYSTAFCKYLFQNIGCLEAVGAAVLEGSPVDPDNHGPFHSTPKILNEDNVFFVYANLSIAKNPS